MRSKKCQKTASKVTQDAARENEKSNSAAILTFFKRKCTYLRRDFSTFVAETRESRCLPEDPLWCSVVKRSSAGYPIDLIFPRRTDSNCYIRCTGCRLDRYARELSKYHLCYCSFLAIYQISLNFGLTLVQFFGPLLRG